MQFSRRADGVSRKAIKLMRDPTAQLDNRPTFMNIMHDSTYNLLSPGCIKTSTRTMFRFINSSVNNLSDGLEIEVFKWFREQLTPATGYTFWGPDNIFATNPSLVDDFNAFEAGMVTLMIDVLPCLTAPKAWRARKRLQKGLLEYYQKGHYKNADKLIQERFRLHSELGLSLRDQAYLDLGMVIATMANSNWTPSWFLNNVYSRPALLAELREEIELNATKTSFTEDGHRIKTISYKDLQHQCPLLNSCWRETLRLLTPFPSSRIVTADHLVNGRYLLRANTMVNIANGVIHYDTEIWGPDAHSFNPRRFLTTNSDGKTVDLPTPKNVHPAAFRAFGGGSVFCPGRHFAKAEIMSFVAVFISGFDFVPPAGQDSVKYNLKMNTKRVPIGITRPLEEFNVRVVRREGEKDVEWNLVDE